MILWLSSLSAAIILSICMPPVRKTGAFFKLHTYILFFSLYSKRTNFPSTNPLIYFNPLPESDA